MKKLEKQERLFIILTAVLFAAGRLGVLIWPSLQGRLLSIGYILFTASDAMLVVRTAVPETNAYLSHIVLAVYYAAIILIALRIRRET